MSREESFDMLDRWLRNNMDDEEYSEYFGALWDVFSHPQQASVPDGWREVLEALCSRYIANRNAIGKHDFVSMVGGGGRACADSEIGRLWLRANELLAAAPKPEGQEND